MFPHISWSMFNHNLQFPYAWLWLNKLKAGRLLDGSTSEKAKKREKRGSEVGSRHHLLQMFAAINLLCSSCTMHAATKMDKHKVKSAKRNLLLKYWCELFFVVPQIVWQEWTDDLSWGIYVFLWVTAAAKTEIVLLGRLKVLLAESQNWGFTKLDEWQVWMTNKNYNK